MTRRPISPSSPRWVLLALWLTLLAPGAAMAQTKVAVIDTDRVLNECAAGKRMQAMVAKLVDSRARDLEARQAAFAREKEAFDKELQGGKMSQDNLRKKSEKLQRELSALQEMSLDSERKLEQKRRELQGPIQTELTKAVSTLAKAAGASVVIDRSAVRFVEPELDLTTQAIAAVDAVLK